MTPKLERTILAAAALCAAALSMTDSRAEAATIVVDTLANPSLTQLFDSYPTKCPLRYAIRAANENKAIAGCPAGEKYGIDVITFDPALFADGGQKEFSFEPIPGAPYWEVNSVTKPLEITETLVIAGPGADKLAISPKHLNIAFVATAGTTYLKDLTVRNGGWGENNSFGAGLVVQPLASAQLERTVFEDNITSEGGAIANLGHLYVYDSVLRRNKAALGQGGAIVSYAGSGTTLVRSTLTGNHAEWGGGAVYAAGILVITESTLSANTTPADGGGFTINGAVFGQVTNSTISGNSAHNGGGIAVYGAPNLQLLNVTIANNWAGSQTEEGLGGGIYSHLTATGTISPKNTLLADNYASSWMWLSYTSSYVLMSLPSDCRSKIVTSKGYNLVETAQGCSALAATDLTGVAAKLGSLANNGGPTATHALLSGSPAIDHGTSNGAPATDQRGMARGSSPDIGAYERIVLQWPAL